ncbi:MAG: hypothetical protein ACI9O3_001306, partial [Colwellia sp.]
YGVCSGASLAFTFMVFQAIKNPVKNWVFSFEIKLEIFQHKF